MLKGTHHTKETKIKMSEAHKDKKRAKFTEEHRGRMSLAHKNFWENCSEDIKRVRNKKISESLKGKHLSVETRQKVSDALKGKKGFRHSKETRMKMSKSKKGKSRSELIGIMPKNIQRPGKWMNIKRGYYNINGEEIFFRSKMEANYALYLDFLIEQKQIRKWEYELDIFIFEKIKFGTRSYRPDFKVYNLDNTFEYHEVKGWMTAKSKTQIKRMTKYHPEIKLIIIDHPTYRDIREKIGKMLKFY